MPKGVVVWSGEFASVELKRSLKPITYGVSGEGPAAKSRILKDIACDAAHMRRSCSHRIGSHVFTLKRLIVTTPKTSVAGSSRAQGYVSG